MMRAVERLLYGLFPRRCEICGEVITPDAERCEDCLNAQRISGKICLTCGKDKDHCDCAKSLYRKPRYDGIFSPFYYKDSISVAIRRMKLMGYRELTQAMGVEMSDCITARAGDVHFDFVTYVPVTKKRTRVRGYNQAKLLAQIISECLEIPLADLLEKNIATDSQRTKSGSERRGNVFGVFDLIEGVDVDGKTILLIDDVKTTGATLSECADMLKIYGADRVYAATFAIR